MYYSAAKLVHTGDAAHLYTGADTGNNPQKLIAPPGSPILRAAQAEGLSFVGLYVYPPILADLLLPLTLVPLQTAAELWLYLNGVFLVLTALLTARLLRLPARSWGTLLILVSVLCFTPVLQCLHDGQITIFLLLLWVGGLVAYQEDRTVPSAALFALATAIKLTPALVLVPFLLWRKGRFIAAYGIALLALTFISLWMDTPHTFAVYFTRVMPAMSGPLPALTNYSLAAAGERLVAILRTGSVALFPETLPHATVLLGRAISGGVLLALITSIARAGHRIERPAQVTVLALLALMAPILSPVSWFHAYATAFIAFALLWRDGFRDHASTAYLMALTAVSLLLGSAVSENLIALLAASPHVADLASFLQFGQLSLASAVVLSRIWKIGSKEPPASMQTAPAGL